MPGAQPVRGRARFWRRVHGAEAPAGVGTACCVARGDRCWRVVLIRGAHVIRRPLEAPLQRSRRCGVAFRRTPAIPAIAGVELRELGPYPYTGRTYPGGRLE